MKTHLLILVVQSSNKAFILLLFIASLYSSISVSAQDCSTPDIPPEVAMNFPWFGSPDYLPAFMDSLNQAETQQGNNISSIVPNIKWRIPIKFWISKNIYLNSIHKTY